MQKISYKETAKVSASCLPAVPQIAVAGLHLPEGVYISLSSAII